MGFQAIAQTKNSSARVCYKFFGDENGHALVNGLSFRRDHWKLRGKQFFLAARKCDKKPVLRLREKRCQKTPS